MLPDIYEYDLHRGVLYVRQGDGATEPFPYTASHVLKRDMRLCRSVM